MSKRTVRSEVTPIELDEAEVDALRGMARRFVDEDASLQDVVGVSEEFVRRMERFAHSLYTRGRNDEVDLLLEAVLALDSTRYYPYLLAGDVAMQEGEWEEAVQCLAAAREYGPSESMVEGKLGEALLRTGRVEEGVVHLRNAVAVSGDPGDPYRKRSTVLLETLEEVSDADSSNAATGRG